MPTNHELWQLLAKSQLMPADFLGQVRTECQTDLKLANSGDSGPTLEWLVEKNRISTYQMEVLSTGQPGPFVFENYRIHAKQNAGPMQGTFRARHIPTNHPVRLAFLGGSEERDVEKWSEIHRLAMGRIPVASPYVCRCYESVKLDQHRFVVFEDQPGKTLSEKLPYKGRLPWPQAVQALELLALAMADIHKHGTYHGRVAPDSVWLQPAGTCQLAWRFPWLHFNPDRAVHLNQVPLAFQSPRHKQQSATDNNLRQRQRDDLFSLGALAFRVIAGKTPKIDATKPDRREREISKHLAYCDKHNLPDNVQQVLRLLLAADIDDDLKDATETSSLLADILDTQSIRADIAPPTASLAPYVETLDQKRRREGFLDRVETISHSDDESELSNQNRSATVNTPLDLSSLAANPKEGTNFFSISARDRLARRKSKSSKSLPLLLGLLILACATVLGFVFANIFRSEGWQTAESPDATRANESESREKDDPIFDGGVDADSNGNARVVADAVPIKPDVFRPQQIVDNEPELPWESPTAGEPYDVDLMPPSPEALVAWQPGPLASTPEAIRLVRAFGLDVDNLLPDSIAGLNLTREKVRNVKLSFHTTLQDQFESVVMVQLATPTTVESLFSGNQSPKIQQVPNTDLQFFNFGDRVCYFRNTEDQPASGGLSQFAVAAPDYISECWETLGPAVIGRSMKRMLDRSDRDRHFSLLFRPVALQSQQGVELFRGRFESLRRPLSLFLDDRMEAIHFSGHFDGTGSYLEWFSEQNSELANDELATWWPENMALMRDELNRQVSQITPHPYWAAVQQRFDNMLNELVRQSRTGIEKDGVLTNCWLPATAPHNLVVAGELVLNGAAFEGSSTAAVAQAPATLQQLLDRPRDLTVTNDPDLINLLKRIEQEIRDDYPNLPFDFRIKLLGADLAAQGITQNQRPGKVSETNRPLGQILAQIMLQANPDKSATDPSDEKCKLVWLIGPDPDAPEAQAVLITTRQAATQRNWMLPAVFLPAKNGQ